MVSSKPAGASTRNRTRVVDRSRRDHGVAVMPARWSADQRSFSGRLRIVRAEMTPFSA